MKSLRDDFREWWPTVSLRVRVLLAAEFAVIFAVAAWAFTSLDLPWW